MTSVSVSLTAYIVAATLLAIAPGLDTALVLRTAISGGSKRAVLASLGIATGCIAWTVVVALGLGALLAASELAYTLLRWIGAAYLVYIGYRMLRYPRRGFVVESKPDEGRRLSFATGLFTNLLNPKVGVFYVTFLPQFVPHGVPVAGYLMLLGVIHVLIGLVWFACLITATRPLARFLGNPAVVRACDRATGGMFVAFGAGLALESRRLSPG